MDVAEAVKLWIYSSYTNLRLKYHNCNRPCKGLITLVWIWCAIGSESASKTTCK